MKLKSVKEVIQLGMTDTFISFKKKDINKDKFISIKNDWDIPIGGLWASPLLKDNKYISAWHEHCIKEGMEELLTNDAVTIKLKEEAKIYIINSMNDFMDLINISGVYIDDRNFKRPNFENMGRLGIDVIYLTKEGLIDNWDYCISSVNIRNWDVESLLILNLDSIKEWEYINLNII